MLAAFNRDHLRSTEAGLKYFVLGALSSGMMLYGISLIYGFTGSTEFAGIAAAIGAGGASASGVIFGIVFLIAGLAFKVSAVPFHMWTPDVYEGAPTPITAYLRHRRQGRGPVPVPARHPDAVPGRRSHQWRQIIVFISVLSMALGAVAAIGQKNIKRLMAYSSIGHMGYALLGLAAGTRAGRARRADLSGHLCRHQSRRLRLHPGDAARRQARWRTSPTLRVWRAPSRSWRWSFAMLFLSLAGLPPLAGFFAKFYVFLRRHPGAVCYVPAVLGVLASAVGLVYYLRLVKVMYFDEPARGLRSRHRRWARAPSWWCPARSRCSSSSPPRR